MDQQLIVQNPVGPVCILFSAACSPVSFFLLQVQGEPGSRERKPRKAHKAPSVALTAELVKKRNISISSGVENFELHQKHRKLSNEDKKAAMLTHVEELAAIMYENRHRFPKKPLRVTQMRTNQWYVHRLVQSDISSAT